jgi:ClpP class serine protease
MAKKHSLFRLTNSVYNTPHLTTATNLDFILSWLERRNFDIEPLEPTEFPEEDDCCDDEDEEIVDGFGILKIAGTLTYQPVEGMCGEIGCSYTGILEDAQELIDNGCHTIIMEVSSGGGSASHCFEYATYLRELCDENGVELLAYIDECSASAAYALTCIADEIYINPSAQAGSIGCVISLMDTSKAMQQAGLKRIYITSGSEKVPFDNDGSFKQSFLDDLQKECNKLNEEFTAFVSKYTGLTVDTIKGFQAKCFNAEDSVANGLVNGVLTKNEFAAFIAAKNNNKEQ